MSLFQAQPSAVFPRSRHRSRERRRWRRWSWGGGRSRWKCKSHLGAIHKLRNTVRGRGLVSALSSKKCYGRGLSKNCQNWLHYIINEQPLVLSCALFWRTKQSLWGTWSLELLRLKTCSLLSTCCQIPYKELFVPFCIQLQIIIHVRTESVSLFHEYN